jgi:hypothetical protein
MTPQALWIRQQSHALHGSRLKGQHSMLIHISPVLYRARNAIERMFCHLKDFRWIATRYDRLATNFHAAVLLAAIVSCWLWARGRLRALCYIRAEVDPPERGDLRSE